MNFEKAVQYVRNAFEQHPEHKNKYAYREKFGHTLRVYKWAETLLKTETADENVLLMAVIFHDVGYTVSSKNHMKHSAAICKEYLHDNDYDSEYINRVCEAIINHDKKELLFDKSTSIEQVLLIEADNLDESGALSILRDTLAEGREADVSYNAVYERICMHPVNQERMEKLSVTPTARKIWKKKLDEYNTFIEALKQDLF